MTGKKISQSEKIELGKEIISQLKAKGFEVKQVGRILSRARSIVRDELKGKQTTAPTAKKPVVAAKK